MNLRRLSILGVALFAFSMGSAGCSKKKCNLAKGMADYLANGSGGTKTSACLEKNLSKSDWSKLKGFASDPGGSNSACEANNKTICKMIKPHLKRCDAESWYNGRCK